MSLKHLTGFQVLLDQDLQRKLSNLSIHRHVSKGAVIRELLRCAWSSAFTTAKYCTNSVRCPLPNPSPPADIPEDLKPEPELQLPL